MIPLPRPRFCYAIAADIQAKFVALVDHSYVAMISVLFLPGMHVSYEVNT